MFIAKRETRLVPTKLNVPGWLRHNRFVKIPVELRSIHVHGRTWEARDFTISLGTFSVFQRNDWDIPVIASLFIVTANNLLH